MRYRIPDLLYFKGLNLVNGFVENICVCMAAEDMDRLDEALRCTVKKLWPIEGKKIHAMLIPPSDGK